MEIHGEFHDQADAKGIVIRRSLWGHNDTLCGRPAPGRPISRPKSGHLQGIMGGFSYYQLVIIIFNIVPLIMEFTIHISTWSYTENRVYTKSSASPPVYTLQAATLKRPYKHP
jgi:hypothetical protein